MTDTFDPGPGWKLADAKEQQNGEELVLFDDNGRRKRVWVREVPVPPLPTEPGYYQAADGSVYRLDTTDEEPVWDDTFGNPQDDAELHRLLPFERLEPRATTAKTVLNRVEDMNRLSADDLSLLQREFKVCS
jgi:hypothetical protein